MRDNLFLHRFTEKCNLSQYQLCLTLPVDALVIPASIVLSLPHFAFKSGLLLMIRPTGTYVSAKDVGSQFLSSRSTSDTTT